MNIRMLLGVSLLSLATGVWGAGQTELQTDEEKFSYAIGFQIAQSLKRQGLEVEQGSLIQAIQDVLSDTPLRLSMTEMQAAVESYRQKQMQQRMAVATKNEEAGQAYMAANKEKKGVTQLESGLQYKVIKKGEGTKPKVDDTVEVHYRGSLISGEEFDSSYARGETATFALNGVIPGWQEALQLMPEGAKWQVIIPPTLAYGAEGAGDRIGPNETLVFEIELISVKN